MHGTGTPELRRVGLSFTVILLQKVGQLLAAEKARFCSKHPMFW
jgi:hypothetical protein